MPRCHRDDGWAAFISTAPELPPRNAIDLRELRRVKEPVLQRLASEDQVGPHAPMAMSCSMLNWAAKVTVGHAEAVFPLDDMDPVGDAFCLAQEAVNFLQGGFTLCILRPHGEYALVEDTFQPQSVSLVDDMIRSVFSSSKAEAVNEVLLNAMKVVEHADASATYVGVPTPRAVHETDLHRQMEMLRMDPDMDEASRAAIIAFLQSEME
jgi:hypothetical protein